MDSSTFEISETDDPMVQQMNIIRNFIRQARSVSLLCCVPYTCTLSFSLYCIYIYIYIYTKAVSPFRGVADKQGRKTKGAIKLRSSGP